jgi:hypothetical protein
MIAPETPDSKKREKLPSAVRQDECGGYIPLPHYPGIAPLMAVNLRDLELLPITDIGTTETATVKFRRVASIDSPFRERIGWAYVQIAGRLGVPECDMESFIEAIISATRRGS